MDQIKKSFAVNVSKMPKITKFPIKITCELHDSVKNIVGSSTIEKGLVESMERLRIDLKRPFKDLLKEAMDDLVNKYQKDRLIREKEAVA